ncbi:MAG TPA: cytochrome c3 family protein [Candidatus Angelobacter sp.]|jgi:predicted CXXCH cytochrome family protein|nr:cytochrome c3 family protein [Candidatus Angelobacter sp.]
MPIKRGKWYRAAVIAVAFVCFGMTFAKPPRQPQKAAAGQAKNSDSQKDKKNSSSENIAPQESEYHKVDPSQYVGADTCKACHEDVGKIFDKGPHWKTTIAKRQGPQWQGCEACHGPGKEHAESADPAKIIRFPGLSGEEASKRCLGCHEFGKEHANFLRSQHVKNNVGCVDCHSIHHPRVEQKLLRAALPTLCYSCHLEVKPDSSKPFHHKVKEGLDACTSCHDPHG